jgi:shikimate dehydrogenase
MNEAPRLAAVIGWPIGHSRSPALHGHWLKLYRIAGHYVPLAVAPGRLAECLEAMALLGFRGCNVTIPHKEAAMALAAEASETARRIGAANTLTFLPGGGFHADNTDAYGLITNLRQSAPDWQAGAGPALVLGAGGAARAVVAGLLDAGAPELRLANRTQARAEELAAHFGPAVAVVDWARAAEAAEGAATIVNTTLRPSAPSGPAGAGPALVLGAGGAARAVVAGLLDAGAPELRLANRTRARAEELAAHFGPAVAVVDWARAAEAAEGAATIVNTTSMGMEGQPPLEVGLDAAPATAVVTDIVYQPLVTPFLAAAAARGLRTVDGLGMLLHQAAPGFEAWFGVAPQVDADLRAAVLAG